MHLGYRVLDKDNATNGSDHRAVVFHCDTESYIGMEALRPPRDGGKQRIRAATSAQEKGELNKVATIYTAELETL